MRATALFVTCLIDQFYPVVGVAAARLLDQAGHRADFPEAQTCCGQLVLGAGFPDQARTLARRFVEIFEPYEAVVSPSGSCVSMVRVHVPELLADEGDWRDRAQRVAARTFELSEFLAQRDFVPRGRFEARVAYHPACHALRELGVDAAPRRLLEGVDSLQLVELPEADRCCGFGGAFSIKSPALSSAILEDKLRAVEASGAEIVTSTDVGCLMHLGGALKRRGSPVQTRHLAEILVGEA